MTQLRSQKDDDGYSLSVFKSVTQREWLISILLEGNTLIIIIIIIIIVVSAGNGLQHPPSQHQTQQQNMKQTEETIYKSHPFCFSVKIIST